MSKILGFGHFLTALRTPPPHLQVLDEEPRSFLNTRYRSSIRSSDLVLEESSDPGRSKIPVSSSDLGMSKILGFGHFLTALRTPPPHLQVLDEEPRSFLNTRYRSSIRSSDLVLEESSDPGRSKIPVSSSDPGMSKILGFGHFLTALRTPPPHLQVLDEEPRSFLNTRYRSSTKSVELCLGKATSR
ncbi:unnamed protein product [Larinioides sclopetarius]|uniref:Uncharacterized protein n=1 Tax=Larinioides sclopetarius TaxID=280406 RepID=A0AAV2AS65_9ARAC